MGRSEKTVNSLVGICRDVGLHALDYLLILEEQDLNRGKPG